MGDITKINPKEDAKASATSTCLRIGSSGGCCQRGNEPTGSVSGGQLVNELVCEVVH
jgi:hypothetical protein